MIYDTSKRFLDNLILNIEKEINDNIEKYNNERNIYILDYIHFLKKALAELKKGKEFYDKF